MSSAYPISSPVEVTGTGGAPGQIDFSDGTNVVEVKAPTTLTGTVNFTLPDSNGSAGQVLTWSGATGTTWAAGGGGGGNTNIWFIKDEKTSGTSGGIFTAGAWQIRVLNTLSGSGGSEVQLASNQLTIADGVYTITCQAPARRVQLNQARLRNITDGVTEIVGGSVSANAIVTVGSFILGEFTVSGGPKVYEIQHQCAVTRNDGFGAAAGFGESEIYTSILIVRVSD